MIYLTLFLEFFKIGLFAIGGGMVTIPFLFDLTNKYPWFSSEELTGMIGLSESTPGPIGVNMATFAGISAASTVIGGIVATIGLITPSVIIIMIIARAMKKYKNNQAINNILTGIRPAVLALILGAGVEVAKVSFAKPLDFVVFIGLFGLIFYFKRNPIVYILASAVIGVVLQL